MTYTKGLPVGGEGYFKTAIFAPTCLCFKRLPGMRLLLHKLINDFNRVFTAVSPCVGEVVYVLGVVAPAEIGIAHKRCSFFCSWRS